MPKQHATLAPSAAERWIHCPGSIKLSDQVPSPESTSYADEGTVAHTIGQLKLEVAAGEVPEKEYGDTLHAIVRSADGQYWCGEMDEATDYYRDQVLERLAAAGDDATLLVEQRYSLEPWVPEGFGTSDAVIIGGSTIEVIDLKYGKGIKVEAKGNPQLRLYGLGAAMLFGDLYDLDTVRMTIIQPRLDHISTEELPLAALYAWAENVVKPAATAAMGENAPTACGDWCRWCPAKAVCRTRAEKQLELAAFEFQRPALLSSEEIADILGRAEALQQWVSDVEAYALQSALDGTTYAGWKLVEGRSVRKYADDLKVAETLKAAGYDEALLYERKLLGLTAMEKLVGKKKLTETLGDLIVKPAGKPVLVPESDKRPPINTTEGARNDFSND